MSPLHARHLVAFLTHGPDDTYPTAWYRRIEVTEATWPELRAKVMRILNEQLFSARAREADVPLVSMAVANRLGLLGTDSPAVQEALGRIRRRPSTEPRRLTRVRPRLRLAVRALVAR